MSDAERAASTYSAAADHFDDPALSFWDRYGRRTVSRADLAPGQRVLDACCGTGASALPAAHAVGPDGRVIGLDLAEPALARGRAKARERGLANVELRVGDVRRTGLESGSFDAVVCVFGIFFLEDMTAGIAELWRLVRPGGRLAVTVWGPRFLEPATAAFWAAVRSEDPALVGAFQPWTRVTDADALARLLEAGGVVAPDVEPEAGTQPLAAPEDWWSIVLGTGFRATVERLGADAAARVRTANLAWIRDHAVRTLETNVIYGVARKPGATAGGP
jgi:ubiquinone/menaquinone biosynthesis C-methylase UbiE